jgi:hypothetical protein
MGNCVLHPPGGGYVSHDQLRIATLTYHTLLTS